MKKDPFFLPKVPPVDRMCERCPFKPGGFARHHEDFAGIVQFVALGLPFYCHETVITSPLTTLKYSAKEKAPVPDPPFQKHFRSCKGAVLYKRGELPEGMLDGTCGADVASLQSSHETEDRSLADRRSGARASRPKPGKRR